MSDNQRQITTISENIVEQLTKENADYIRRYGSIFLLSNRSKYEDLVKERYAILRKEFDKLDADKSGVITFDEFKSFFSNLNPEIPEEELRMLFSKLDIDSSGDINLDEFVEKYLILEERVKIKKLKLDRIKNDLESELEQFARKAEQYENEQLNPNGISPHANISIKLKEGEVKGVNNPGYKCKVHVTLLQDGKVIGKNDIMSKVQGSKMIFDSKFNLYFQNTNKLLLRFELFNTSYNKEDLIGSTEFKDFTSQSYISQKFGLTRPNDTFKEVVADLYLSIRFFYSYKIYYQEKVNNTTLQIEKKEEEINDAEKYINLIKNSPFDIITKRKMNDIDRLLNKNENVKEIINNNIRESIIIDTLRQSVIQVKNRGTSGYKDSVFSKSSIKEVEEYDTYNIEKDFEYCNLKKNLTLLKLSKILVIVCLLGFIYKNEFLGLLIGAIGIIIAKMERIPVGWKPYLLAFCAASLGLDIIWIICYTKKRDYINKIGILISYIISIVNVVIKGLLTFLYYNEYKAKNKLLQNN